MRPRFILDPQDLSGRLFDAVGAEADVSLNPGVWSHDGPRFADASSEISLTSPFLSHDTALGHDAATGGGQTILDAGIAIPVQDTSTANTADAVPPAVTVTDESYGLSENVGAGPPGAACSST